MSDGVDVERASGYAMRGLQRRVIEGVGRAIVGGTYAPGALVPKEAELTEEYGVSRTSVREAMRVLAAKGLVDIRQKIGTRVRRTEQWNVFDADILRWYSDEGQDEVARITSREFGLGLGERLLRQLKIENSGQRAAGQGRRCERVLLG